MTNFPVRLGTVLDTRQISEGVIYCKNALFEGYSTFLENFWYFWDFKIKKTIFQLD